MRLFYNSPCIALPDCIQRALSPPLSFLSTRRRLLRMQMVLQVQCMGIKRGGGHKAGRGDDSTWQTTRHKCNKKRETVHMQMRGTGEDCGFGGRMKGCSVQLGHKESLRNALGALFSFSAARWVGVHARRATMLRPAGDSPVPGERTVPASTCTWPGNHCEMQIWRRRLGWTGLGRDNKRSLWG